MPGADNRVPRCGPLIRNARKLSAKSGIAVNKNG